MFVPKPRVTFKGSKPACFDSQENYNEWKKLARFPGSRVSSRVSVCADCEPEFQERMMACGRCENPEIVFEWVPVRINHRETTFELQGCLPSVTDQRNRYILQEGEDYV